MVWNAAHAISWPLQVPLRWLGRSDGSLVLAGPAPHEEAAARIAGDRADGVRPVVLVHGIGDNPSLFPAVRAELVQNGRRHVVAVDYAPERNDVREVAADLARHVRALVGDGPDQVDVVAHSLGGLIARYYVQRLGGHEHVRTLVTAGTPHHGTLAGRLLPTNLGRQLRPGSELFAELDRPAPGVGTRFVSIASGIDHLILPAGSALLSHPDLAGQHHVVPDVGHMSLAIDPATVALMVDALTD